MWHFRRNWGKNAACSMQQAAQSSRSTTDGLSQPHNRANVSRHAGSIWIPVCLRVFQSIPQNSMACQVANCFHFPTIHAWLANWISAHSSSKFYDWVEGDSVPFPSKKKRQKSRTRNRVCNKIVSQQAQVHASSCSLSAAQVES